MDYLIDIKFQLLIKEMENVDEAISYAEDFLIGVNELSYSDDENDDHYEIMRAQIISVKEK